MQKTNRHLLIRFLREGERLKKGSLTVETAFVFPLFFFCVVALIYIIMWFQTAEKVQKDMVNEARFAAAASYAGSEDSEEQDENIDIYRLYPVRIECPVISLIPLNVKQGVHMRKFIGVYDIADDDASEIVYITENGEVYHRNRACRYLKIKTKEIQYHEVEYIRNMSGEKYKSCLKCIGRGKQPPSFNTPVYVTDYGNRYHITNSCRAISRNVMAVLISEAGGKRACSKCG